MSLEMCVCVRVCVLSLNSRAIIGNRENTNYMIFIHSQLSLLDEGSISGFSWKYTYLRCYLRVEITLNISLLTFIEFDRSDASLYKEVANYIKIISREIP